MNKLNSFLAAGLITLASVGVVTTPVFAADTMPSTAPISAPAKPMIKNVHANRARIEKVQQALNGSGAALKVDGKWGPKTAAALKDFQKARGLKASGRLDEATRTQLLKA